MKALLLALSLTWTASKVVDLSVSSSHAAILSQFCFPTGKGSIAVEAKSPLVDQHVAFLEVLSTAEVHSILEDSCERINQESLFAFTLSQPNKEFYNFIEVDSPRRDFCVTGVVASCNPIDPSVDLSYYVEFLNEGLDSWNVSLSLEDESLPSLLNFYTLVYSVAFLIFLKFHRDSEKMGAHGDFVLCSLLAYGSFEAELVSWLAYYWSYSLFGSPAILLKSAACYAHWLFEVSSIALLSLHATGHFLRTDRAPLEVKIVLSVFSLITFYLAVLRSTETEELVEFHWFCWSSVTSWTRLLVAIPLLLWSCKGFIQRADDTRDLFGLLAYVGLLWTLSVPGIIWLTKLMMRFRWKFYQALLGVFADGCFLVFSLVFVHPESAAVIFSNENVVKALKSGKV